jgi:transposase-like protein
MTEDRLPLAELLAKAGDGDFLRNVAEAVVQLLMETEVEGLIGAGRHERTAERATQQTMVSAALRQVFTQLDHSPATQTMRHVADKLRDKWPKLGTHRRERGRRAGLHEFPGSAPSEDPLDEPDRAVEQGSQAPG